LLEQCARASANAAGGGLLNVNGLVGDDEFQAVGGVDVALLKGAELVERRRSVDRIEFAPDEQCRIARRSAGRESTDEG
jgi:hypothetical protein